MLHKYVETEHNTVSLLMSELAFVSVRSRVYVRA